MSDVDPNATIKPETEATPEKPAAEAELGYHFVPYTERAGEEQLYSFREAMQEPQPSEESKPETEAKKPSRLPMPMLLLGGAVVVLVVLGALAAPMLFKKNPLTPYIDLGARRFDPAGLSGRLIVRWESGASYELAIDPIDPQQTAEFQSVAQDPPHLLSVSLRLLDASGVVACQKDVVLFLPESAPADRAELLKPRPTGNGDMVKNLAGEDGNIAEIDASGSLPCTEKDYRRLAAWEFYTNFPSADEQNEWLRHEKNQAGEVKSGSVSKHSASLAVQRLSTPIEGDDVIVGDNPSRGTVTTSGGRVFWLKSRGAEWQVFPAAIHFRCDKNGSCVLTRANTRTALQARLSK